MHYIEPSTFMYGRKLTVASRFVYLGSTLNNTSANLDGEVSLRIQKASFAFGKLGSHLWTVCRKHLKLMDRFHQQCLRRILRMSWKMFVSDDEVLERVKYFSIEGMLVQYR